MRTKIDFIAVVLATANDLGSAQKIDPSGATTAPCELVAASGGQRLA
jgi:hypothetical protein